MKPNKPIDKSIFSRVAAALFWLLLWQGAAMLLDQPLLLASPVQVTRQLFTLLGEPALYRALLFSLTRVAGGFLLGAVCGALLAVCAARTHWVETLLRPLMITVRSVPVASFIILALVWLSAKQVSVFIVFLMVLPILYGNLLAGLHSESTALTEMARMYHIPRLRRLLYIELPQLKPHLLSALSLGLGLSWKAGVAAEVIGIPTGSMGAALYQAKLYLDTPALYAWTLIIVLASVLFEKLILFLVKRAFARLERL